MQAPFTVRFRALDPRWGRDWPLPTRATPASAGVDLRAAIEAPLTLSQQSVLVPTGLALDMGGAPVVALIFPRSGLGHKQGIVLGNGTGVIDSDYQGQLMVSLVHRDPEAPRPVIAPGDRIAQLVFLPVLWPEWEQVADFEHETQRGAGGFGHSGRQ